MSATSRGTALRDAGTKVEANTERVTTSANTIGNDPSVNAIATTATAWMVSAVSISARMSRRSASAPVQGESSVGAKSLANNNAATAKPSLVRAATYRISATSASESPINDTKREIQSRRKGGHSRSKRTRAVCTPIVGDLATCRRRTCANGELSDPC